MKILFSSQKGACFQIRVKYTDLVQAVATIISCGWNVRQINLDNPHAKEVSRGLFQAWIDANHLIERCRLPEASFSGRDTKETGLGGHKATVMDIKSRETPDVLPAIEKDDEFSWAAPSSAFSMPVRRP